MLIAYLSEDEVNRDLAARMAAACGATLHFRSSNNPPPDGGFDAAVYDLESMPPRRRGEVVARLLAAPSTRPEAVHAYNLDAEADALQNKGVIVTRRLGPAVLRSLCRSLSSAPTPGPPVQIQCELADMDLLGEITVSALGVASRDW
jgi:hypothetical protein